MYKGSFMKHGAQQ